MIKSSGDKSGGRRNMKGKSETRMGQDEMAVTDNAAKECVLQVIGVVLAEGNKDGKGKNVGMEK